MNANPFPAVADETNAAARRRLLSRRGEPLFLADWDRALFMHYEVDVEALQRDVPFPLDLREGRAYVSFVTFILRGMRFRFGGRLSAWLCRPIATSHFLNFRTYVRHRGEPGIFFLTEWLSSRLCVRLGPLTFGLPYRFGAMNYEHRHETGTIRGEVRSGNGADLLRYEAALAADGQFSHCTEGSLDEFLLERYTAFTSHGAKHRYFRIWHSPWMQTRASVSIAEASLIANGRAWFAGAKRIGANYSPGARNVWMGWPHRIRSGEMRRRTGRLSAFYEV